MNSLESTAEAGQHPHVAAVQHNLFTDAYAWTNGAADVAAQVATGAAKTVYHAVKDHPGQTALTVAEGVAVGVALVATAPVAASLGTGAALVAGITIASDAAIVGLTAYGAVHATRDSINAAHASASAVDILMHRSAHSQAQVGKARQTVQSKTGLPALEVTGTVAMTVGAVASGMRLASVTGSALKSGLQTFGIVEDTTILGVVARGGGEIKTAVGHDGLAKGQAKSVADGAEHDKANPLAPDAISNFTERFNTFVRTRQSLNDINPLIDRLDDLKAVSLNRFSIGPVLKDGETTFLSDQDMVSVEQTRQLLKGQPQAAANFEEYLANQSEQMQLTNKIDREMLIRRNGVAQIINQEAKVLFPRGLVPTVEVESLPAASTARATYGRGVIGISDNALNDDGSFEASLKSDQLAGRLLHETQHAEQDGLMIRHAIDTVTGGDTSGRILTPEETAQVEALYKTNVSLSTTDQLVNDVNQQRAGRVLNPTEVKRADKLESSFREFVSKNAAHVSDKKYLQSLNKEVKDLEEHPYDFGFVLDNADYLFSGRVPAAVQKLRDDHIGRPDVLPGEPGYDEAYANAAAAVLIKALGEEIKNAQAAVYRNSLEYRGWEHEKEAFAAGDQADRVVGKPEDITAVINALRNLKY